MYSWLSLSKMLPQTSTWWGKEGWPYSKGRHRNVLSGSAILQEPCTHTGRAFCIDKQPPSCMHLSPLVQASSHSQKTWGKAISYYGDTRQGGSGRKCCREIRVPKAKLVCDALSTSRHNSRECKWQLTPSESAALTSRHPEDANLHTTWWILW